MDTTDIGLAKDAAGRIDAIGLWSACAYEATVSGPLGIEAIVGIAVFPKMSQDAIIREMKSIRSTRPPSAIVMVTVRGWAVNVEATRSKLAEAQLVRRLVLDAASERAPIIDDGLVPFGPAGIAQPEQMWREN